MINPMDLSGRTMLVTGAGSGIGLATAQMISRLGGRVVLSGRDEERLQKAADSLAGGGHLCSPFDLASTEDIGGWLRKLADNHGPLHGLVHSAGMHLVRPVQVTSLDHFNEVMRVNTAAAFLLAKGFRQKGVSGPQPSIVFLSSVMGLVGQPGQTAYSASKGAIVAMTRSLALEFARDGIRVNCVAPAMVKTPMFDVMLGSLGVEQRKAIEAMHPLGFGTPQDVASAVAFLLADTGRWITGSTLVVDGGYTVQ